MRVSARFGLSRTKYRVGVKPVKRSDLNWCGIPLPDLDAILRSQVEGLSRLYREGGVPGIEVTDDIGAEKSRCVLVSGQLLQ